MEEPKNKGGRPRKDPAETLKQRSLRLHGDDWQEYDLLGGVEWLRGELAKSRRRRQRASEKAG